MENKSLYQNKNLVSDFQSTKISVLSKKFYFFACSVSINRSSSWINIAYKLQKLMKKLDSGYLRTNTGRLDAKKIAVALKGDDEHFNKSKLQFIQFFLKNYSNLLNSGCRSEFIEGDSSQYNINSFNALPYKAKFNYFLTETVLPYLGTEKKRKGIITYLKKKSLNLPIVHFSIFKRTLFQKCQLNKTTQNGSAPKIRTGANFKNEKGHKTSPNFWTAIDVVSENYSKSKKANFKKSFFLQKNFASPIEEYFFPLKKKGLLKLGTKQNDKFKKSIRFLNSSMAALKADLFFKIAFFFEESIPSFSDSASLRVGEKSINNRIKKDPFKNGGLFRALLSAKKISFKIFNLSLHSQSLPKNFFYWPSDRKRLYLKRHLKKQKTKSPFKMKACYAPNQRSEAPPYFKKGGCFASLIGRAAIKQFAKKINYQSFFKKLQFSIYMPQKKSFFCYWLLPFIGFLSFVPFLRNNLSVLSNLPSISTIKQGPSSYYSPSLLSSEFQKAVYLRLNNGPPVIEDRRGDEKASGGEKEERNFNEINNAVRKSQTNFFQLSFAKLLKKTSFHQNSNNMKYVNSTYGCFNNDPLLLGPLSKAKKYIRFLNANHLNKKNLNQFNENYAWVGKALSKNQIITSSDFSHYSPIRPLDRYKKNPFQKGFFVSLGPHFSVETNDSDAVTSSNSYCQVTHMKGAGFEKEVNMNNIFPTHLLRENLLNFNLVNRSFLFNLLNSPNPQSEKEGGRILMAGKACSFTFKNRPPLLRWLSKKNSSIWNGEKKEDLNLFSSMFGHGTKVPFNCIYTTFKSYLDYKKYNYSNSKNIKTDFLNKKPYFVTSLSSVNFDIAKKGSSSLMALTKKTRFLLFQWILKKNLFWTSEIKTNLIPNYQQNSIFLSNFPKKIILPTLKNKNLSKLFITTIDKLPPFSYQKAVLLFEDKLKIQLLKNQAVRPKVRFMQKGGVFTSHNLIKKNKTISYAALNKSLNKITSRNNKVTPYSNEEIVNTSYDYFVKAKQKRKKTFFNLNPLYFNKTFETGTSFLVPLLDFRKPLNKQPYKKNHFKKVFFVSVGSKPSFDNSPFHKNKERRASSFRLLPLGFNGSGERSFLNSVGAKSEGEGKQPFILGQKTTFLEKAVFNPIIFLAKHPTVKKPNLRTDRLLVTDTTFSFKNQQITNTKNNLTAFRALTLSEGNPPAFFLKKGEKKASRPVLTPRCFFGTFLNWGGLFKFRRQQRGAASLSNSFRIIPQSEKRGGCSIREARTETSNTKTILLNLLNELLTLKKSIVLNKINEKSSYVALPLKKFNKKFKKQKTNLNTQKNLSIKTKIVQPKFKLSFFQNTTPYFKVQKLSLTKSLYKNLSLLLDRIYTAFSFHKNLNYQSHLMSSKNSPVSYSFQRNALNKINIKNHSKANVKKNVTWFPLFFQKNKKLGNYSSWLKKQIVLNNECSADISAKAPSSFKIGKKAVLSLSMLKGLKAPPSDFLKKSEGGGIIRRKQTGSFVSSQLNFFLPKLANNFKRNYNVLSQNKIIPKIIQCKYPIIKSYSIPAVLITESKATHRPTLRFFSNRKLPQNKERILHCTPSPCFAASLKVDLNKYLLSNLLYRPFVLKKSYNSLLKISPQMISSVKLPFKKIKRNPTSKLSIMFAKLFSPIKRVINSSNNKDPAQSPFGKNEKKAPSKDALFKISKADFRDKQSLIEKKTVFRKSASEDPCDLLKIKQWPSDFQKAPSEFKKLRKASVQRLNRKTNSKIIRKQGLYLHYAEKEKSKKSEEFNLKLWLKSFYLNNFLKKIIYAKNNLPLLGFSKKKLIFDVLSSNFPLNLESTPKRNLNTLLLSKLLNEAKGKEKLNLGVQPSLLALQDSVGLKSHGEKNFVAKKKKITFMPNLTQKTRFTNNVFAPKSKSESEFESSVSQRLSGPFFNSHLNVNSNSDLLNLKREAIVLAFLNSEDSEASVRRLGKKAVLSLSMLKGLKSEGLRTQPKEGVIKKQTSTKKPFLKWSQWAQRSGFKKMKGILFLSKNKKHVFNLNNKNKIEKNFINQRNVPAFAITFDQPRFSKLKNFYPLYTNINYRDLEVTKFGIKTRIDKLFRTLLSQSLGKPGNKDTFKKTFIVKSKTLSNRLKMKYNLFTTGLKTNLNNKPCEALPGQMIPQTKRPAQISLKQVLLRKNKETNLLIKNRFYKITNFNFTKLPNVREKKDLNKLRLLNSFDSKKAAIDCALKWQEAKISDEKIFTSNVFVPQKNYKRLKTLLPTRSIFFFFTKKNASNNSLTKRNIKKKNVLNFSQHKFPLNFEIKNNQFIYTLYRSKRTNSKIEKPIKLTYKYFVNNFAKKNLKNTKLTTDAKNKIILSSFNSDYIKNKQPSGGAIILSRAVFNGGGAFLNSEDDFLNSEAPLLIRQNQKVSPPTLFFSEASEGKKKQVEKKNLQKKRRALKQRRETGRLLKRKRFYPRPTWLRLTMYRKFLNLRHKLPKVKKLPNLTYMPCEASSLVKKNNIKITKNTNIKIKWNSGSVFSSYNYNPFEINSKPVRRYKSLITDIATRPMICAATSDSFNLKFNNKNKLLFVTPSLLIESQPTVGFALTPRNNFKKFFFVRGAIERNAPAFNKYLTTPIFDQTELYNVSPICNALTELKSGLSSRLKTNLNSYLRRLKLTFKQLKTTFPFISRRQWGYEPQTLTLENSNKSIVSPMAGFETDQHLLNFLKSKDYFSLFEFVDPYSYAHDPSQNIIKGIATIPTLAQNLLKWETSIKKALLAEISGAKRIEQIITNIKYNLTGKLFSNSNKLNYPALLIDQELYETQKQSKQPNHNMHALNSSLFLAQGSKSGALLNARQIWNNASKKIKLLPSQRKDTPIQKDFSLFDSVTSLIQKPAASLSGGLDGRRNLSNLSFELPFFTLKNEGFSNVSKQKVYWAINKTHMWLYKNGNKKKYLWANQKQREQNRSNKTKKLISVAETTSKAAIEETYIINSNSNFSATQSYNLFLRKQKQKENKISAAGFYDSKLCLPKNHISKMLPQWVQPYYPPHSLSEGKNQNQNQKGDEDRFKNKLTRSNLLKGKESHLAPFLFSINGLFSSNHSKFNTPNAANTSSLHQWAHLAKLKPNLQTDRELSSYKQKTGILKDHQVFLRHLKVKLQSNLLFPSNQNLSLFRGGRPATFNASAMAESILQLNNSSYFERNNNNNKTILQPPQSVINQNSFLKQNFNYSYSYVNLYNQQKKVNGLLVGQNSLKHRANNYLEKRLISKKLRLKNYPYKKNSLSNFLSSSKKLLNFLEITNISHLNFNINFQNSTNTFFYLIFVMCTIQIFHLCSLFSLTSSSEIRSVIKFFILFSLKIIYFYTGLTHTIFLSIQRLRSSKLKGKVSNIASQFAKLLQWPFTKKAIAPPPKKASLNANIFFFNGSVQRLKNKSSSFFKENGKQATDNKLSFFSEAKKEDKNYSVRPKVRLKRNEFLCMLRKRKSDSLFPVLKSSHLLVNQRLLVSSLGLKSLKNFKWGRVFKQQSSPPFIFSQRGYEKASGGKRKSDSGAKEKQRLFKLAFLNLNKEGPICTSRKKLNINFNSLLLNKKHYLMSAKHTKAPQREALLQILPDFLVVSTFKKDLNLTTDHLFSKTNFKNKFVKPSNIIKVKIISLQLLNGFIKNSLNASYFVYRLVLKAIEIPKTGYQSICSFFEKPGESFSDWIINYFLIEIASDLTTTIPENLDSTLGNITKKIAKASFGGLRIIPIFGTALEKRLFNSFQGELIEILSQPDTDLIVRQKKVSYAWDIWGEILRNIAEKNNINMSLLTNKKEDQAFLISQLLENNQFDTKIKIFFSYLINQITSIQFRNTNNKKTTILNKIGTNLFFKTYKNKINWELKNKQNYYNFNITFPEANNLFISETSLSLNSLKSFAGSQSQWVKTGKMAFLEKNINFLHKPISKKNNIWKRWSANQFMTYKDKDSDLFIQAPPAPSLAKVTFKTIKHYNSIQAPIGNIICQIYSGLFSKKTAKNFLVVGALSQNSNFDEKSLLIQSLAGETEMKIIKDNANRYNFTLGIKSLRNVFDALALHTPCIFLIEDIHVIGERRPFLVGDDENAEAIQNSSGIEPHQHLDNDEKNLSIAKLTRHVVMHYKKPFWGDYSNLIPTNNYSFDFFLGVSSPRTREYHLTPLSPILLEKDSIPFLTKSPIFSKASILQAKRSLKKSYSSDVAPASFKKNRQKKLASEQPPSMAAVKNKNFKEEKKEINIKTIKLKNTVNETAWLGLAEQTTVSNDPSRFAMASIRVKIALLAHLAVSNLSVKLNMITDLLVIIDSVRSNRGFVVFATTHTPSILDPALRRPGRLDETISLPFIPKLENRWEIVKSNVISFNSTPSFFSFKNGISNNNFIFKGKSESGFPFGLTVDLLDYSLTNKQASFTSTSQTGNFATKKLQNSAVQIQTALIKFKKTQSKLDQISLKVNQPLTKKTFSKWFFLFQWLFKNKPHYPNLCLPIREAKGPFKSPLVKRKAAYPKVKANLKPAPRINESFFLNNILEPSIFNKLTSNNSFFPSKIHFKNKNHKRITPIKKSVGNLKKHYILLRSVLKTPALKTQKQNLLNFVKPILFGNKKIIVSSIADKKIQMKIRFHYYEKYKTNKVLLKKTLITSAYSKIGQLLINNKFAFNYSKQPEGVPCFAQSITLLTTLHSQFENQNEQKEYESPYLNLYTKQKNIKQILMNLFTAKVTETFVVNRPKINQLPIDQNYHQKKTNVPIFRLLNLQSIDKTWRKASSLIFAYIEKQLIYKKSLVIPKLLQFYNAGIQSSTLQDPPSAPLSFLLLPAKRYENYKRSFLAMQNQNASYDKNTIFKSVNLNKTSLEKRLLKKKRYTLVDNNKFNNSATFFNDKSPNTENLNINNLSQPLVAVSNFLGKPTLNSNNITNINSYYRNRLLNRHRGYINNQWWNGQLSEHNVETTFLSDVDWRSNFVSSFLSNRLNLKSEADSDKLLPNSRSINNEKKRFAPLYGTLPRLKNLTLRSFKKPISEQNIFIDTVPATIDSSHFKIAQQEHSINKPYSEHLIKEQSSFFDSLLDYPDFDQHYNPKNRRWILNFGYWSSFKENLQKNHNKEIYSYLVMESFLKTYHYLNSNREILDYLTTKLIKLGLLKENTLIDSIKRF